MNPGAGRLTVAMIHDVFHEADADRRLRERLRAARTRGADLAVLPELPLHPWVPATRSVRAEDAECPEGPRHRRMSDAAREAGIALLGGAIVTEPASGRRRNRALLFDSSGHLAAWYDKAHLPAEPGYWESDHYEPGDAAPQRVDGFGLSLGLQICSDLNRPEGCHLLGALGVEVILAPRATPPETYERWRLVIRANAVTSSAYVISTNRPAPESDTPIGGPSLAVIPDGEVLLESTEPLSLVVLERTAVARARRDYPGYLAVRPDLYAAAWAEAARRTPRERPARDT